MTEKSSELTVNDLYLLCKTLKKEGHGDKIVNIGYDSNCVYTTLGLYSKIKIIDNDVFIDEYDYYYHDRCGIKKENCVDNYLKKFGDVEMTEKTTEMIDKEIEKVTVKFDCVEDIIGRLALETGRKYLVHRELRTFNWFVNFMIFGARKEKAVDDFDLKFKNEYDNFRLNNTNTSDDLYKWACLYYIYCKTWQETDEYKRIM